MSVRIHIDTPTPPSIVADCGGKFMAIDYVHRGNAFPEHYGIGYYLEDIHFFTRDEAGDEWRPKSSVPGPVLDSALKFWREHRPAKW